MPKIIENAREQIIEEARRQLFESGYAGTTIRSVASACGIGIGTVYNYFPSKDLMFSAFILEDWRAAIKEIEALSPEDFEEFYTGINSALGAFVSKYEFLFRDKDATATFASVFSERHIQLRHQIAGIIAPTCEKNSGRYSDPGFLSGYVAESVLLWIMSGTDIKDQLTVLRTLLG